MRDDGPGWRSSGPVVSDRLAGVLGAGLEPAQPCGYSVLSAACIPVSPPELRRLSLGPAARGRTGAPAAVRDGEEHEIYEAREIKSTRRRCRSLVSSLTCGDAAAVPPAPARRPTPMQ